jgi:Uma2 family endonuclease
VLTDDQVPEARRHRLVTDRVTKLLLGWAERTGSPAQIGCNLAVRWDRAHPQIGLDPDVYIVEPPPPEGDGVVSLLLWQPGHYAPRLAVEVVSASLPHKDYEAAPAKYAVCGVRELWILDPELDGPRSHGGPYRIQIWRREDPDRFVQLYAGGGPAWSPEIGAWLHAVDGGLSFDLTSNEAGRELWLTPVEAERAAKEVERAAKEAALRRIAELEALLAQRQ